jgi:hypothetical protein
MIGRAESVSYARKVALLACPFCREMFKRAETGACPVCGVALVPMATLPLSDDALSEDGITRQPEWEKLPAMYLGRNRGLLAVLAAIGLAFFFLPWVHETLPDVFTYTGFDLGRRLGWVWGGGVAWFVLLPTVLSRRAIMQMRGARVAATFLSAVPGVTAALLLLRPPHGAHGVPLRFTFEYGLYATLVLSAVAVVAGLTFGGRVDQIKVRKGTSAGQVVH